ncbi:uncharacterized protein TNCV_1247351 [Trichonephila clavipes]|uniref:Uncharacterized protein n=1 Tax=Trichonephila clavipes TaxID=2585209 RepID=A0A8X6RIX5_TRICX|nr:uncharacterized protein TNCV_1247351 [Trichonephila clavipes]
MFLEPLLHNFSLVTRGVVLLKHSISSWRNRCHVRVQLVRNDVQITCSINGLLYHSHGYQKWSRERPPKHNTATKGHVYDLLYIELATVHLEDSLT